MFFLLLVFFLFLFILLLCFIFYLLFFQSPLSHTDSFHSTDSIRSTHSTDSIHKEYNRTQDYEDDKEDDNIEDDDKNDEDDKDDENDKEDEVNKEDNDKEDKIIPTIHASCAATTDCGGNLVCDNICRKCKNVSGNNCSADIDCATGTYCYNWVCTPKITSKKISKEAAVKIRSNHNKKVNWNDAANRTFYISSHKL